MPPDHPHEICEKQVAEALEHLWDYVYLGRHSLAGLELVKYQALGKKGHSHVDVGRALSEILQEAIQTLEPSKRQMQSSRERDYYLILQQAYVEVHDNKTIARSLNISERTLYRHRTKAIAAIAQILEDWETGTTR